MKYMILFLAALSLCCWGCRMAETADIAVIDGEDIADVSPWEFDSITEEAGNALTLSADAALHGTKGYKCTFSGSNDACYGTRAFSEEADAYTRTYLKFPSFNAVNGTSFYFYPFYDGATSLVLVGLTWHTADNTFGIICAMRHNGGFTTILDSSAESLIALNTLYYIDVRYKNGGIGTGGVQLWLNGESKVADFTTYDTSNYKPDKVTGGIVIGTGVPFAGSIIYLDDHLISTTGPIGAYSEEAVTRYFNESLKIDLKY